MWPFATAGRPRHGAEQRGGSPRLLRGARRRLGRLQTSYPSAALATITGDHAHAAHLHEQSLRLAQELEFWADAADRLTGLGRVALLTGDFPRAAELHRHAMALAADHGYAAGEIHAEIGLALGARRAGDFDLAEQHLRAAAGREARRAGAPVDRPPTF
ncbi:tetratricopeptide repeat protein [Streptomyces sp. NPDC059037]|uniref:tetratricopeptide repeat protein n=1 Tax=Streptomyces sp. NPDC059037 TaxID=3346710 RepID=UPI00367FAED3